VDSESLVWQSYECRSWPTVVLVDSAGSIRFHGCGEVDADRLLGAVDALCEDAEAAGATPAPLPVELDDPPDGVLAFPTKLAIDPESAFLWIADTGHHRVIAVDTASATIVAEVGDGTAGAADGEFALARLRAPRGLAVRDGHVFVADTGNHCIRDIGVRQGIVTTIVGTGILLHDRDGGGFGRDQGLASPWDLGVRGDDLFIAIAGSHQIWHLDLLTACAAAFVGGLSQPMGIAVCDEDLVVVEAESNEVCTVSTIDRTRTSLVAASTFDFGRIDGALDTARLQHPRGIAVHASGEIFIADTCSDAIRRIDAGRSSVQTVRGGATPLRRPEGIACSDRTLFVADTDNHRIVTIDLDSGAVDVLRL
jgi:DNA-binding beta-propeller fold protein YncE